jgi:hypothetical protein
MVTHNYNPSYIGGICRRIIGQGWPLARTQGPTPKVTKAKESLRVWLKW